MAYWIIIKFLEYVEMGELLNFRAFFFFFKSKEIEFSFQIGYNIPRMWKVWPAKKYLK